MGTWIEDVALYSSAIKLHSLNMADSSDSLGQAKHHKLWKGKYERDDNVRTQEQALKGTTVPPLQGQKQMKDFFAPTCNACHQ
jgi:hypothetical protein